jgi:hypothetical protein
MAAPRMVAVVRELAARPMVAEPLTSVECAPRRILAAARVLAVARPMRRASQSRMHRARWRTADRAIPRQVTSRRVISPHIISRNVMPGRVRSRVPMPRRVRISQDVLHGAIASGSARRRISARPYGPATAPR